MLGSSRHLAELTFELVFELGAIHSSNA